MQARNINERDNKAHKSGVIQGSGIGPVAFVVFIDALATLLEVQGIKTKKSADNVNVS